MTTSLLQAAPITRAETIADAVVERFIRIGEPSSIPEIAAAIGLTPAAVRIALAAERGVVPGTVLDYQSRGSARWSVFFPTRTKLREVILVARAAEG